MHNIILTAVLLILGSVSASAQFYTITKEKEFLPEKQQKVAPDTLQRSLGAYESCKKAEKDSFAPKMPVKLLSELYARKVYARVSHEKESDKGTEGTTVCERKSTSSTHYSQSLSGNHPQWHPASEDSTGTSHTGKRAGSSHRSVGTGTTCLD